MLPIYCISGLGADHRIFLNLKITGAELHFIDWETPALNDDMSSYALKLASQVRHKHIILMGVSFGGMLSTEITRLMATMPQPLFTIEKTIVISSCKHRGEFPGMMRMAGNLNLHKLAPYNLVLRSNRLNRFVFDLQSKTEELYLKRQMLENSNLDFIKRSIHIILKWKAANSDKPLQLIHIHGTKDRLLTPTHVKADYWIKDGGHFMVWNKAAELSKVINEVLAKDEQL